MRKLRVFPQDAYPEHAAPRDYTRAVLNADGSSGGRSRSLSSRNATKIVRDGRAQQVRIADGGAFDAASDNVEVRL